MQNSGMNFYKSPLNYSLLNKCQPHFNEFLAFYDFKMMQRLHHGFEQNNADSQH